MAVPNTLRIDNAPGYSPTAITMTLHDVGGVEAGFVYLTGSDEKLLVTSFIISSKEVTFTRGYEGTTAVGISDNDVFTRVSTGFAADIRAAMTGWIERNSTLKNVEEVTVEDVSAAKLDASAYAAQRIQDLYGEVTDGTVDPIALQIGVLLAIKLLRNYIPFKVNADNQRALDAVDKEIETERKRRRQKGIRALQTNRSDSTLSALFPNVTN